MITYYISDAPRIEISELPSSELSEGDSVTLRCSASANPPAQITWRREGTGEQVSDQPELILPAIKRSQADTYVCQAKNSLGLSAPKKIPLSVHCK